MKSEGPTPLPITATKSLIAFLCLAVQKVASLDADHDGKIKLTEVLALIMSIGPKIPKVYQAIPLVLPELHDLTDEERAELHAFFVDQFDLPSDRAEAVVELSTEILQTNFAYYQRLRDLLD